MKNNRRISFLKTILFVTFLLGVAAGVTYGQETHDTAPDTTITEETTTATTDTTEATPEEVVVAPRFVSPEDIAELQVAQEAFSNAGAIVQYVLTKIIRDYGINTQAEVLNIKTGAITPRAPATQ